MAPPIVLACARAPTNIAVVKYWGKRDAKLNLPINSSLSVTLHMEDLRTVTTVALSPDFERDRVWLNGDEQDVSGNKRLQIVIAEMRRRARDDELRAMKVHVASRNSFPTAAGLASSASGYACLVKALAKAFAVEDASPEALSEIARQGSGSATRSLFGGFAKWEMGAQSDGSDSLGAQVQPLSHWPEMHAIVCVASDHKKLTSSTGGMTDSVSTSALLAHRAATVVPERMRAMEAAVADRDFAKFAELTMRDSNQFHATCLDTWPPIAYMKDVSHAVSRLVHEINEAHGEPIAAYTFDAGPNAVIFLREEHVQKVLHALLTRFGPQKGSADESGVFVQGRTERSLQDCAEIEADADGVWRGSLKYLIHTRVGPGAEYVEDESAFLLDPKTGMPLA